MIRAIIALAICITWPTAPAPGKYKNPCRNEMIHTPLTPIELGQALKDGHKEKFGYYPDNNRLAVGWAQVALENGQGHYTYNYNFGKITSNKNRPFYVQRNRFRAHRNPIEGATDYWNVVEKICSASLAAFNGGNPRQAALILKRCGYYEANKTRYSAAMSKLYRKALKDIIPNLK